ncbi:MAG: hypothetical protein HRU40_21510 [Saprospiraceae bacterium]|nr:hypothetical protein [Saprospiraceae bacterium]
MKNMKRRSNTTLAAFFALIVLSSCNRGYGCPTNFSIEDGWNVLINLVAVLF